MFELQATLGLNSNDIPINTPDCHGQFNPILELWPKLIALKLVFMNSEKRRIESPKEKTK